MRTGVARPWARFFGGSREQLMTTLLAQEAWTDEELDALQAQIDRVRKERER